MQNCLMSGLWTSLLKNAVEKSREKDHAFYGVVLQGKCSQLPESIPGSVSF